MISNHSHACVCRLIINCVPLAWIGIHHENNTHACVFAHVSAALLPASGIDWEALARIPLFSSVRVGCIDTEMWRLPNDEAVDLTLYCGWANVSFWLEPEVCVRFVDHICGSCLIVTDSAGLMGCCFHSCEQGQFWNQK